MSPPTEPPSPPDDHPQIIDPETGLPLPEPFPDYVSCPHCGEPEVEVWCYREGGSCHACAQWVPYARPAFCGKSPGCKIKPGQPQGASPS